MLVKHDNRGLEIRFPFEIYMHPKHQQELMECEWGSWEDNSTEDGELDVEEYGGQIHPVQILQRQKDRTHHYRNTLVVEDTEEATAIAYAVASGTFQLYCPRVAVRVFDLLLPYTDEEFRRGPWAGGPTGT